MATTTAEGAIPDFLRMDQPVSSDPANARKTGNWHGWPTKDINPVTLTDTEGRTVRIRAPVLHEAGLTAKSLYVRAEGSDLGVPPSAAPGTKPFYYDKGLPIEKALHPDTILAWAQNGQLLEHLHGAPVRLLVPGWSGNWSVKWLTQLEVVQREPDCWYHYQFYYYGTSPDDAKKRTDHHDRGEVHH